MVGRRGREGEEESQRGAATKAADSSSSRLCTHAAGEGKWAPWVQCLTDYSCGPSWLHTRPAQLLFSPIPESTGAELEHPLLLNCVALLVWPK